MILTYLLKLTELLVVKIITKHTALKLVSAIFYEISIFSPNDFSKAVKNVFYPIEKALFVLEIFKFL